MKTFNLPNRKSPCKECPFSKTCLRGWLGKAIKKYLSISSFLCHKNTNLQCAGHMILKGNDNTFVRYANLLKINPKLSGHERVFDTEEDCIEHHKY